VRLPEGDRFRDTVAFHCQQAVEKYVKAILVRHRVEFRKTHDIGQLLDLFRSAEPKRFRAMRLARWSWHMARGRAAALLTPFLAEEDSPGEDLEAR
jgi:HEPN domain-containing protein